MSLPVDTTTRVAHLNDVLRTKASGGQTFVTSGIRALSIADQDAILMAVESYDDFAGDNDPYGEHDFGALTVNGHEVFWKIDYYDESMQWASPDPTDPQLTRRVLTIMLALEW